MLSLKRLINQRKGKSIFRNSFYLLNVEEGIPAKFKKKSKAAFEDLLTVRTEKWLE
ncbi:hypothetical protein IGK78_002769 [Enterococcus sp. DIV1371a]